MLSRWFVVAPRAVQLRYERRLFGNLPSRVVGWVLWALPLLFAFAAFAQNPEEPQKKGILQTLQKILRADEVKDGEFKRQNPLWIFIGITVVITALTSVVAALKRDRIIRKLNKKYAVLIHESGRYTGILKLILQDVEIASEKTDVKGKDSGRLFTTDEFKKLVALARYHDELTEKEVIERKAHVERLYNPTFAGRLWRRLQSIGRQFKETVKTIYDEAIGKRIKSTLGKYGAAGEQVRQLAETQIEETTGVAPTGESQTGTAYRLLIDRLIGTRIITVISGEEYECVLADYTKDYYHFMDMDFKEKWQIAGNYWDILGNWLGNDKGLRITLDRNTETFTIESRVPYPVTFRHLEYKGSIKLADHVSEWTMPEKVSKGDYNQIHGVIEPYGKLVWKATVHEGGFERDVAGGGAFQEVKYGMRISPLHYNQYTFHFESVRRADVIVKYSDNQIQYRAEKFEPRLVTLDTLTEVLWHTTQRFVLTDKEGRPIRGLHLNRGYITNLSKDRTDIRDITTHYSRRWDAQRRVGEVDSRVRPIRRLFRAEIWPFAYKAHIAAAQIALVQFFKQEARAIRPAFNVLFFPFVRPRHEWAVAPPVRKMPMRIGVLSGRPRDEEFLEMAKFRPTQGHRILFRRMDIRRLDRLNRVDILWIGYGANFKGNQGLSQFNEQQILKFAARGGVVIGLAPNTFPLRGKKLGWVPDPLVFGKNPPIAEVHPTTTGEVLLHAPHVVDRKRLKPQVWWDDWSDRYIPLATAISTTVRGEEFPAAVGLMLPYGHGLYLIFGIGAEAPSDIAWSVPLAENLIHYAVHWKEEQSRRRRERFAA